MERQRKILVAEFQREKEKMMSLDHKMKDVRKQYGTNGLSTSQYSYCQDQDDMVSCLTLNARGILPTKLFESHWVIFKQCKVG